MSLINPDSRRAVRTIVEATVALSLIGLLYWLTYLLDGSASGLTTIARGALGVIGIGTLFYGAENVTRAIKINVPGGYGVEFGEEAPPTPVTVVNAPTDPIPTKEEPKP